MECRFRLLMFPHKAHGHSNQGNGHQGQGKAVDT
jgi:hypothetical protein